MERREPQHPRFNPFVRWAVAVAMAAVALALPRAALAVPEAHILRIDPRAGMTGGAPLLTTVVEVVQFNSPSEALAPCNNLKGNAALDCWSSTVEKDGVLWSPFPFPEANALFTASVAGADVPAKLEGHAEKWGDAVKAGEPNVGTAWVVSLDASNGMGARFADAKQVAYSFIQAMQPNDLMELVVFDSRDHQYLADSKWKTYKERNDLVKVLDGAAVSHDGGDRSLFSIIKGVIGDAFGNLGNYSAPQSIPLHQALVVLSNGTSKADASTTGPVAEAFSDYLNKGRFPDDNTAQVKTPLPVISIWFPNASSYVGNLYRNNENQFMQQLANVKIGGFFSVVRQGQGQQHGPTIVKAVKKRFDAMYLVKWRLACLNPSVEQSFALNFKNTKPQIVGDSSFKDVPIGIDPTQWPLDIDEQRTKADAEANPLYPGGTFKVYGDFCWGGDKNRAEAYFVPAGTKPDPNASSPDPATAKKAMQSLIQQNMRGGAIEAGDTFVTFKVPDEDKILDGTGDATVAHVIVYDNGAKRASGHDEKSILTLKATKKPIPWLLFAGIGGGVVVLGLLIVVIMRGGGGGGGGGRRRGAAPPPSRSWPAACRPTGAVAATVPRAAAATGAVRRPTAAVPRVAATVHLPEEEATRQTLRRRPVSTGGSRGIGGEPGDRRRRRGESSCAGRGRPRSAAVLPGDGGGALSGVRRAHDGHARAVFLLLLVRTAGPPPARLRRTVSAHRRHARSHSAPQPVRLRR